MMLSQQTIDICIPFGLQYILPYLKVGTVVILWIINTKYMIIFNHIHPMIQYYLLQMIIRQDEKSMHELMIGTHCVRILLPAKHSTIDMEVYLFGING